VYLENDLARQLFSAAKIEG